MRVYYKDNRVIATHRDDQLIDANVYGENVSVITVPDDTALENITSITENKPPEYSIPEVNLEELKRQSKIIVVTVINEFSNTLMAGYPQSEMLSWGTKDLAARAYLADEKLNESQELLLNTEKEAGGYASIKELCEVIVANSDNFVKISGLVAGIRVSASQAIDRAINAQEVQAVIESVKQKLSSAAQ